MIEGTEGCKWFLAENGDVWCADPSNQKGLCGTPVTFQLPDGQTFTVTGPWFSNPKSLSEDLEKKARAA